MALRTTLVLFLGMVFLPLNIIWSQTGPVDPPSYNLEYSKETKDRLKQVVDSLHQNFKSNQHQQFFSRPLSMGHYIRLDTVEEKVLFQIQKDLKENISIDSFTQKYPQSIYVRNRLLHKYPPTIDSDGNLKVLVMVHERDDMFNWGIYFRNDSSIEQNLLTNKWVWIFSPLKDSIHYRFKAIYFKENFNRKPFPEKYNHMIRYLDHMVDSTKVFYENRRAHAYLPKNYDKLIFLEKKSVLDQLRGDLFYEMDLEGGEDGIAKQWLNIATVSADVNNWPVFIRAHLNIINDNFYRHHSPTDYSDQGYIYIRTLEELEVNVVSLLLATVLIVDGKKSWPSLGEDSYRGVLPKIAHAIYVSAYKEQFKSIILEMISDDKLDMLNRLTMIELFKFINAFVINKKEKKINREALLEAIVTLPRNVYTRIDLKAN